MYTSSRLESRREILSCYEAYLGLEIILDLDWLAIVYDNNARTRVSFHGVPGYIDSWHLYNVPLYLLSRSNEREVLMSWPG